MNNIDVNLTFINSTFINVENLNRDSSIAIGILITFCSVFINSFAVFLIVTKSKKETTAYKIALVSSRVLLCSAQFQFGFLMCIVPLLPFPAFIFYGVLRKHVDLILLIQIWVIQIVSFLWTLFGTLVIRFRMVVRRNSFLDVSTRTYWIGCVLSYIACTITVIYMFEILKKPVEITNAYIEYRYPKYGNVPKENSLLIFSDKQVMRFSIFSCIAISGGLITKFWPICSLLLLASFVFSINAWSCLFTGSYILCEHRVWNDDLLKSPIDGIICHVAVRRNAERMKHPNQLPTDFQFDDILDISRLDYTKSEDVL